MKGRKERVGSLPINSASIKIEMFQLPARKTRTCYSMDGESLMYARYKQKKRAFHFILLFGAISALGDITYEGARGVMGPYLTFLGASAFAVGLIAGLGEFLGYALRIASGYWIDRSKNYWLVTYAGYAMLLSIPLLAFSGHWLLAGLLFIIERIGKAIRSPGKDTILSFATKQVGTGYGFGLHEALDQIGAFVGPLLFTISFATTSSYRNGFLWTFISVIALLGILTYLRIKVPKPERMEDSTSKKDEDEGSENTRTNTPLPPFFWQYVAFSVMSTIGLINFPLLSLHMSREQAISPAWIPIFYALAMGIDAIVALFAGRFYDRKGFKVLFWIPFFNLPILLGFLNGLWFIVLAVLSWGVVIGIQETIMKAVIADLIPPFQRGRAYAIYNISLGASMLIGNSLMGWIYEANIQWLFWFVLVTQAAALSLFGRLNKRAHT